MSTLADFHFIRPLWLMALMPLALLLWRLSRTEGAAGAWRRVCDLHLLRALLVHPGTRDRRSWLWLLGLGWLLAVLALAGPTWERRAQLLYRNQAARVLVLDLSRSMLADDPAPSRLDRARYKIADLTARDDVRTGLVVFAGDAFVVTPITRDGATIRHLLPVLSPELMPQPGSRPARGLSLAGELLERAGVRAGRIILIGDSANAEAIAAAAALRDAGHRVSVLAVGTEQGAPIPGTDGELLKDGDGNIAITRLDRTGLHRLVAAGGGRYAELRTDDQDIAALAVGDPVMAGDSATEGPGTRGWLERGPWLLLLLLPLAALGFRRGWLLVLWLPVLLPRPAPALEWADLWQRPDQQAQTALAAGQPERAMNRASSPWLRGTAAYRAGAFEQAARDFARVAGATGAYNRGNALARAGRYPEALAAYDQALEQDPQFDDARYNRALVERVLREQQRQQDDRRDGGSQRQSGGAGSGDSGQATERPQDRSAGESADNGRDGREPQAADSPRENPQADEPDTADAEANRGAAETAADEQRTRDRERQQALEQWLRRVPDDPGGLLRRKFLYQYERRARRGEAVTQPW